MGFYINLVELCVSATDPGTDTYAQWTLELGGPIGWYQSRTWIVGQTIRMVIR